MKELKQSIKRWQRIAASFPNAELREIAVKQVAFLQARLAKA